MDARTGVVYSSMYFETGDDRYAWLTRVLGVAKGNAGASTVEYDVFEVA